VEKKNAREIFVAFCEDITADGQRLALRSQRPQAPTDESHFGLVGCCAGGRWSAVAVAEEVALVSLTRRHRHRSAGVQVLLSDYDDVDFECRAVDCGVVDATVV
jgi:hypothetical protein